MAKRIVKNYPSPRLMQTIGATNQTSAEAIGELVANCFDARIPGEQIKITIDIRGNMIKVIDNGRGMTGDVLEKAVCIAEDMSRYIERGEGAKGHFGMGFKTSCATLGNFYEIYTRPVGGNTEYHVEFDIKDYARRPSGADAWNVEIEDRPVFPGSPLEDRPYGTAFVISRLNDRDLKTAGLMVYLGDAFKGHIDAGDVIEIVDEIDRYYAKPSTRTFVHNSFVNIDLKCGPNDSLHIKGWVAIDQQTRNNGLYGFNIYRHGQMVNTWHKGDWFRAHLMTSRVFGEVHMDFLDATFYKQGLQQTDEWIIASKVMKEFLKPVVKASQDLSRKGNIHNVNKRREIINRMRAEYNLDIEPQPSGPANDSNPGHKPPVPTDERIVDNTSNPVEGETEGRPFNPDNIPNIQEGSDNAGEAGTTPGITATTLVRAHELVLKNGTRIPISYATQSSPMSISTPFDMVYEDALDDEPELQVITYTDHPLWSGKESAETVKIIAVSDAIFRVLVSNFSMSTSEAFRIKNEWITAALNKTGE